MKRLLTIVGARPQFIKAAPVSAALRGHVIERLVHTGQHHDPSLSSSLFAELRLPEPDYHLGIHGGSHSEMLGRLLLAIDPVLVAERPDAVLVYGDTNSTLAGALAAAQRDIPVVHVEAGLRSFDWQMPEERNRVLTDRLSALCFCSSEAGEAQLRREGSAAKIFVVGDVMQDAVLAMQGTPREVAAVLAQHGVQRGEYVLATIHRAGNTDDADRLAAIAAGLGALGIPVLLPLHPRTRAAMEKHRVTFGPAVRVTPPLGYRETLALMSGSRCIVTDSGGVQKEAYWLAVPCVTLRPSTEWVETVQVGWNRLCEPGAAAMQAAVAAAGRPAERPPLYGAPGAAQRIAELLPQELG